MSNMIKPLKKNISFSTQYLGEITNFVFNEIKRQTVEVFTY